MDISHWIPKKIQDLLIYYSLYSCHRMLTNRCVLSLVQPHAFLRHVTPSGHLPSTSVHKHTRTSMVTLPSLSPTPQPLDILSPRHSSTHFCRLLPAPVTPRCISEMLATKEEWTVVEEAAHAMSRLEATRLLHLLCDFPTRVANYRLLGSLTKRAEGWTDGWMDGRCVNLFASQVKQSRAIHNAELQRVRNCTLLVWSLHAHLFFCSLRFKNCWMGFCEEDQQTL